MKIFLKMKMLICSELCFDETEINLFDPISGGISAHRGIILKKE
jgi:hypothetical protein